MQIIHERNDKQGVFTAKESDIKAGEMTYLWEGTDKIIIDHTELHTEFKGMGIGKILVLAAVGFAREKELKIEPLCSFAQTVFAKNKDIQDVLF